MPRDDRYGASMKSILDPSFRYTASFNTDVKKTFARIRRAQSKVASQTKAGVLAKVTSIVGKAGGAR